MTISEKKMQIVIDNYFKSECDVNTSIRQAFDKGFRIGVKKMASVEPEIIRCRECKYAEVADPEDDQDGYTCQFHRGSIWFSGSYCSWAERRTDE